MIDGWVSCVRNQAGFFTADTHALLSGASATAKKALAAVIQERGLAPD